MMTTLKRGAGIAVALLALGALVGCSSPASAPTPTTTKESQVPVVHVTVAEQGLGGFSGGFLPHLADKLGYFASEGIVVDNYVSVANGQAAINGMVSGSITFAHSAPEGIVADQSGAGIIGIACGWASPAFFMVAKPGLTSWSDLKGKTIAIGAPNDITAVIVKDLIKKAGLDPNRDVKYVALGATPARVSALLNGQVDATVATLQGISVPLSQKKLVNLGAAPKGTEQIPVLSSDIEVSKNWANSHRSATVAYLRAIHKALIYAKDPAHQDYVINLIDAVSGLPDGSNTPSLKYYLISPPKGSFYFPLNMHVPAGIFASTIKAYKQIGFLAPSVKMSESAYMDYTFADAALRSK